MSVSRFVQVAIPSLLLAAVSFVLGGVLDSNVCFVIGVGFVAVLSAAWFALLDDAVMAALVMLGYVVFAVLLIR